MAMLNIKDGTFTMAPSLVPPGNDGGVVTIDTKDWDVHQKMAANAGAYHAMLASAGKSLGPADRRSNNKKRRRGGPVQVVKQRAAVGRNAPCPCRSGKKFKRCCGARGRR